MKHMLNFSNFSAEELERILALALDMKAAPEKYADALRGKKLYTLFEKTSTRTFLSFATGITELGGSYYNQNWRDSNFGLAEPVSEIKYICRNVDIIMARLMKNETVELFGKHATVPFINGCDNLFHPCQTLADAMTLIEKFGGLDVKLMYIGAKNNVFNSLAEFFSKMRRGTLYGFTPIASQAVCDEAFYSAARDSGHYIELDPAMPPEQLTRIVAEMDAVYTDTWIDMEFFNDPAYADKKRAVLEKMLPYQVNERLMGTSSAIVMHDMPIHAGYEISQGIMEKNMEHILDQAENRRHTEKAIMYTLIKGEDN